VTTYNERITPANAIEIFEQYDIIVVRGGARKIRVFGLESMNGRCRCCCDRRVCLTRAARAGLHR